MAHRYGRVGARRDPGGRTCGLGSITAVVDENGDTEVGSTCGRAGVVGIFARSGSSWRLGRPRAAVSARWGDGGGGAASLGGQRPRRPHRDLRRDLPGVPRRHVDSRSCRYLETTGWELEGFAAAERPRRWAVVSTGPAAGAGMFALVETASRA